MSKQDTKGKYTDQKTDANTNSTPDKVMEPLTRLFTDLIEQLRLLTSLGHSQHNGHPTYKGNGQYNHKWVAFPNSHRQHGNTTHHRHSNAHRDCINDHRHQADHRWSGHCQDNKSTVGHKRNILQDLTPEYMRLSQVVSVILSVWLPLILRSTWMRRLLIHQTHQKLVYPSQDIKNAPKNLRGSTLCQNVIRHPSSPVHTTDTGADTEIVHIGRKSHNKCAVITMIGSRSQKGLWDSGVGRSITSYDCYNSLHPKYKTELFPCSVRIRAMNGTFIANKGECDTTLKINNERFTFPFLCSDQLSQQMILGHNFSKAYHIGTLWNADDVMSLTRNGIPFAETLPTNDINALVFCTKSNVVPPYSNGYIRCRMLKVKGKAYIGRSCVFEPLFRNRSLYSYCNTYEGFVTVDDNIVSSGVFNIAMTNKSNIHIKIHSNQTMGVLHS